MEVVTIFSPDRQLRSESICSLSKVDTIGYVSTRDRINALLESGRNFRELRAEEFDFDSERSIDFDCDIDPTIAKDFDDFQALTLIKVIADKERFIREVQENSKKDKLFLSPKEKTLDDPPQGSTKVDHNKDKNTINEQS